MIAGSTWMVLLAWGFAGFRFWISEAGHQPMVTPDQQYVLVFNGEIFNYVELRSELRELGYQFRSSGDSEVLLAAYREGSEPPSQAEWYVGICHFDRRRRCLFGSRDRFGVKPCT